MKAVTRFMLDAFYIFTFFAVTLGVATGADYLVRLLTYLKVDGIIVDMVRYLARGLVFLDIIGVFMAGFVSTLRFIRAVAHEATVEMQRDTTPQEPKA